MMPRHDVEYYRACAIEEREFAAAAGPGNIREFHEEVARQYEVVVERAELRPILSIRAPKAA